MAAELHHSEHQFMHPDWRQFWEFSSALPSGYGFYLGQLLPFGLCLPMIGLRVINWALAGKLETYEGHIEDFGLSLYRGAYQLRKLSIKKKDSRQPPLVVAEKIDLSLAWRVLLQRKIAADVRVEELIFHAIDSQDAKKKQLGNDEGGWLGVLNVLIPTAIESIKISESAIYFSNGDLIKGLPVRLEHIFFAADDLHTRTRLSAESLSPFWFHGVLQNHANLKFNGKVDVSAKKPRGEVEFSLTQFRPASLNPLLLTYIPIDLTRGEMTVYGEVAASSGDMQGYVNVFLKDLIVIAPKQKFISFKHFAIEILSAFANWVLKNNKDHTLAAHIPFSRMHGKLDIDGSETFWSAVKNKKSELAKGFDHSVSLKNIEEKK